MPGRVAERARRRVWLAAYLAALVLISLWVLFGGPVLLLLVSVLVPALSVCRAHMNLGVSIVTLLAAVGWTTLVVFIVSRYSGAPALVLVVLACVAAGVLCAVRLYRTGARLSRGDAAELAFLSAGGLIWCGVIVLAALLPDGSPVSWAMGGDAANNILFARTLVEQGGITLGGGQNPVPLTAALIGLFMLPGSTFVPPTVQADILALAQMWSVGIVAACLVSGALVLSLVRRRTALTMVAVAIGSILPLSWIMLAGSVALGFVNFHLTLALLVGCLVILVTAKEGVLTSLVVMALSLTLVLALWTPLAVIPGAALLVLVVIHRRAVFGLRGWRLALGLVAIVQAVAFAAAVSLPSFLTQGGALAEAAGAVFALNRGLLAVVAVLAIVFGGLYAWVARSWDAVWVLITVIGGGGAGLAVLLWLRRAEENLWGYYQLKFVWLFIAVLLVVAVALGLALAVSLETRRLRSAAVFVTVLVLAVSISELAKSTVPDYRADAQLLRDPLARILTGDFFADGKGDHVYHRVVELVDAEQPAILWGSDDLDEASIMFWIIQMAASGPDDYELRTLAYYRDPESMEDLCTVRELMGAPVTVITSSEVVAQGAASACPELGDVELIE